MECGPGGVQGIRKHSGGQGRLAERARTGARSAGCTAMAGIGYRYRRPSRLAAALLYELVAPRHATTHVAAAEPQNQSVTTTVHDL